LTELADPGYEQVIELLNCVVLVKSVVRVVNTGIGIRFYQTNSITYSWHHNNLSESAVALSI